MSGLRPQPPSRGGLISQQSFETPRAIGPVRSRDSFRRDTLAKRKEEAEMLDIGALVGLDDPRLPMFESGSSAPVTTSTLEYLLMSQRTGELRYKLEDGSQRHPHHRVLSGNGRRVTGVTPQKPRLGTTISANFSHLSKRSSKRSPPHSRHQLSRKKQYQQRCHCHAAQ